MQQHEDLSTRGLCLPSTPVALCWLLQSPVDLTLLHILLLPLEPSRPTLHKAAGSVNVVRIHPSIIPACCEALKQHAVRQNGFCLCLLLLLLLLSQLLGALLLEVQLHLQPPSSSRCSRVHRSGC